MLTTWVFPLGLGVDLRAKTARKEQRRRRKGGPKDRSERCRIATKANVERIEKEKGEGVKSERRGKGKR